MGDQKDDETEHALIDKGIYPEDYSSFLTSCPNNLRYQIDPCTHHQPARKTDQNDSKVNHPTVLWIQHILHELTKHRNESTKEKSFLSTKCLVEIVQTSCAYDCQG